MSLTSLAIKRKQLLLERCLQVQATQAGRTRPHFPTPLRRTAQTEVPPQVSSPVSDTNPNYSGT